MLTYLRDPANAVTATGLGLSGAGLLSLLMGNIEWTAVFGLLSMLSDQLDGIIAKKSPNRAQDTAAIGKSLDGFNDILYGGALPALIVVAATNFALAAQLLCLVMLLMAALRLSYFSVFGLTNGRFTGMPLSYDMPIAAILLIIAPNVPAQLVPWLFCGAFSAVTILHVSPLSFPSPRGATHLFIAAICIGLSVTLIQQAG